MEAPLLQLAAQLQQRSSCMVLHCSNGERVAAKLLLYESGALPAPDVEPLILRGQAQAFYSCVSRKRQPKEDPSLGADGKDGRSAAPVENVFTATASAATFPEGQEEPVLSERALELPSVPSSEDKVSSCCRLIAICTEPVLGGSGFRMGPKQVGASALEAQQAETFAVPAEAEASPGGRSPASESAAALAVSAAPPTSEAAALVGEPIQTDDPEVLVLSSVNNDGPASLLPMEAAPCAVLSLPNVCVSPCFPLLHDCEAARLMVEGLLRQPLEPQQLVVKGPTQAQEEARDAERHLAQTLDELTDLIESSEAAMPTPL
ncbi:hypothetical protein cyc_02955 [Cyclospora cayetanensis]|uniref:Uncharacterized protein n=1 Tax=Cyclospora cayetanensis TaxID=88456 RepID=A0A1D3D206_9EIME|nr:hypothetical protein cyc_02955 [Cyclospora cayetanensis]